MSDSRPAQVGTSQDGLAAALAEFAALRSELTTFVQIQAGLVGIGVTGLGAILALAAQKDGKATTYLVVPYLSLAFVMLTLRESYRITRLGNYIRTILWPYVQSVTPYPNSWEATAARARGRWSRETVISSLVFEGAVPIVFVGLGAVALVQRGELDGAAIAGIGALAVGVVAPLIVAVPIKKTRRAPSS